MKSYVVDTHALFWYLAEPRRLSRDARAAFDEGSRGRALLYVPAIVIAELYYANVKEGKPIDFVAKFAELQSTSQFILTPFEPDDVLAFDDCAAVPEMHDRMVVVAARKFDAPCITVDPAIVESGLVKVVW